MKAKAIALSVMLWVGVCGLSSAFASIPDDYNIHCEVVSFDYSDSWNWGSDYGDFSEMSVDGRYYLHRYNGINEDVARSVVAEHSKWKKLLLRIRVSADLPELPFNLCDFRIENSQEAGIHVRYTRLFPSGDDELYCPQEDESYCNIYLEALAYCPINDQDDKDLTQRIKSTLLSCNVEIDPYSSSRWKIPVDIKTTSVERDTQYKPNGFQAIVYQIDVIEDPNEFQALIDRLYDELPMELAKDIQLNADLYRAYFLKLRYIKKMNFAVCGITLIAERDTNTFVARDSESTNINELDMLQDGTQEDDLVLIRRIKSQHEDVGLDDVTLSVEFSTELIGASNWNVESANALFGVRFQERLKFEN